MTCELGGILRIALYCAGAWALLALATGIALTRALQNAPVIDDGLERGDEMATYPVGDERVVKIEQFYTYDPGRDEFNVRYFWVDVARDAVRRMKRRESQARALARRLRLVRNAARECDQALRGGLCATLGLPTDTSTHDLILAVRDLGGKP